MSSGIVLPNPGKTRLKRACFSCVQPVLNRILALDKINYHYHQALNDTFPELFAARVLKSMNITIDVSAEDLDSIPRTGSVMVVGNHPFGGLEGLILPTVFETIRPDIKLMANFILTLIPELADMFFAVNPFAIGSGNPQNYKGLRAAISWLQKGNTLGMFPAGEVSHLHLNNMQIMDGPWHPVAARLIQMTQCVTIPVYFYGCNSRRFQVAGLMHPGIRTLMLTREMLKKQNSTISLRIGRPISAQKSLSFETPEKLTDYLRMRTYILKNKFVERPKFSFPRLKRKKQVYEAPVAKPENRDNLVRELNELPESHFLTDKPPFQVCYFLPTESPFLLNEIGRLRELTFRQVGEGTGKSRDIDEYDSYYIHIIVWDADNNEIVGAYRAGRTDKILAAKGKKGLYTSTLFNYRSNLLKQISPALELGRSFIQPRYQKQFAPLMLLWKGIGQYVVQNPHYRYLLGPVSISREYSDLSRWFLKLFLQKNYDHPELSRKVRPLNPPKLKDAQIWSSDMSSHVVQDINEVDELIREMELKMSGVPVLLRQYLKLDAKLLGLNIDPDFGHVLDALLLIDLAGVDIKILQKYMGRDEAGRFLSHYR